MFAEYKHRTITPYITEIIDVSPVTNVTGPQQSGKSTLIRRYMDNNCRYYSLDDRELLLRIKDDPGLFLKNINGNTAIDEAKKAPALFHSLYRSLTIKRPHGVDRLFACKYNED